jgi:hypothetical protein
MILRGVLIRSTIRGGHASLAIAVSSNDSSDSTDEKVVLVVIRFGGSEWNNKESLNKDEVGCNNVFKEGNINMGAKIKASSCEMMTRMRSDVRRMCKIGNELEFIGLYEQETSRLESATNTKACANAHCREGDRSELHDVNTNSRKDFDKFVVDYYPSELNGKQDDNIRLLQGQKWDATRCQMLQRKYFPKTVRNQQPKPKRSSNEQKDKSDSSFIHHKSGLGKRQQGEIVADFLLLVISTMKCYAVGASDLNKISATYSRRKQPDSNVSPEQFKKYDFKERMVDDVILVDEQVHPGKLEIRSNLNILDVAGGTGHVSLALALRNVKSTVIDPRSTVGSLPGRDRKLLKKSKKEPFRTYRAWFGYRPDGVDVFFREGCRDYFVNTASAAQRIESIFESDMKETIPICSIDSADQLLPNCTAIVALHPDEATGVILQTAVKHRIPFVVV